MENVRTFYDMLHVSQGATYSEVDSAYESLLQSVSDDGDFHLIDAAYSEVSEETSRSFYDAVLNEKDEFIKMYHEYVWARDKYLENGQLRVSLLRQLVQSMKGDLYPLYAELGYALSDCKEYEDATIAFDSYLEKDTEDPAILTEKALALCHLRKFDESEILIRSVVGRDANYIPALEEFPLLLRELGQNEIANDFLEREIASTAEREEETFCNLLKNRIIFCFEDGEKEKGRELFVEFMTILKNMGPLLHSSYLYETLLTTLEEVGEKRLYRDLASKLQFSEIPEEDMETHLWSHYEENPTSVDTILPLVEYLRLHERKEEAHLIMSEAVMSRGEALDDHRLHLNVQRAMFHLEDGEQAVAYEVLDKALLQAEKESQAGRQTAVLGVLQDSIEELRQFGEHHWVQKFSNLIDELTKEDSEVVKVETREGCFVATAVYGDYDHPQVLRLRAFRDTRLKDSSLGRWFIRFYYRFSPFWAKRIDRQSLFARCVRCCLNGFIEIL